MSEVFGTVGRVFPTTIMGRIGSHPIRAILLETIEDEPHWILAAIAMLAGRIAPGDAHNFLMTIPVGNGVARAQLEDAIYATGTTYFAMGVADTLAGGGAITAEVRAQLQRIFDREESPPAANDG